MDGLRYFSQTQRAWFWLVLRPLRPAVRPVMINLANNFRQCTFSVIEHYGLFSSLIKLPIFYVKRDGVTDLYSVDRSTLKKLLQEKLNATTSTLKLICTLPITPYMTSRRFRVDGHFKSVRNNRRSLYETATPTH